MFNISLIYNGYYSLSWLELKDVYDKRYYYASRISVFPSKKKLPWDSRGDPVLRKEIIRVAGSIFIIRNEINWPCVDFSAWGIYRLLRRAACVQLRKTLCYCWVADIWKKSIPRVSEKIHFTWIQIDSSRNYPDMNLEKLLWHW